MGSQKLLIDKAYDDLAVEELRPSPGERVTFSISFLTRSSSIAMVGGLASQGLKFLVIIYAARQFSVSEFGLLSFAFAVYAYQFVVCNSGLQFFGSRAVAKSGQATRALLAEISCARVALAVVGTVGSLLLLAFLPSLTRTEFLLVAMFGISNVPWATFCDWVFQGLHRQEVSAVLNVVLQGSWLVLTVLGIRLGMGVMVVPAALALATLIAASVGYLWLTHIGCIAVTGNSQSAILRRSWEILKSATPLGTALWLNTVLIWSDAIIVRLLRGEQAVGWYAAGNRAGLALAMLASYYVQGAFPLLSRSSHEGLKHFQPLFQHCYEDMALVFVPGSIWAIAYAREIVLLLFKRTEYLAAVPVFRIFQIVFLITALLALYGVGALVAFHRDREYRRGFIVAGVVFIPLCIALTLLQGIVGAALAVLSAQVLASIVFARASRDLVRLNHFSALALPLVAGLSVVLVSKLFGLSLFWSALMLAATSLALLSARFRMNYLRGGVS